MAVDRATVLLVDDLRLVELAEVIERARALIEDVLSAEDVVC